MTAAVLVSPLHDPTGLMLAQIQAITSFLKENFERAFISLSPPTEQRQGEYLQWMGADDFFAVNLNTPGTLPGDHYLSGYRQAIRACVVETALHLCDLDRIIFAYGTQHRAQYQADLRAASARAASRPTLFQRSTSAWATYPQNYRRLEHLLIEAGELLFGKYFDFAWSYMVMNAAQLTALLPQIESHDFGILIEMVLLLRDELFRQDVDWLAWEDPLIYGVDADELRQARDASREETEKRLRGLLPFFAHFLRVVSPLSVGRGWDKPEIPLQ
ncbi:MAG: hypothetical protein HN413_01990 [Chloroflexi bacterium]|jgi:hypothetical protein|nr:hypothetical protein [Chloroflexota bacterium]